LKLLGMLSIRLKYFLSDFCDSAGQAGGRFREGVEALHTESAALRARVDA